MKEKPCINSLCIYRELYLNTCQSLLFCVWKTLQNDIFQVLPVPENYSVFLGIMKPVLSGMFIAYFHSAA
jgi:hypothetical protein